MGYGGGFPEFSSIRLEVAAVFISFISNGRYNCPVCGLFWRSLFFFLSKYCLFIFAPSLL